MHQADDADDARLFKAWGHLKNVIGTVQDLWQVLDTEDLPFLASQTEDMAWKGLHTCVHHLLIDIVLSIKNHL